MRRIHRAHIEAGSDLAENLVGFRVLRQGNQRSAGAENAGFFARDGGDGRAQPLGVVERNIGNHGEQRIDDVGCVQPAAHPHFKHRNLRAAFGKVQKCLRSQNLKVAGQLRQPAVEDQLVGCVVDAKEEGGEGVVVDLDAVKSDALVGALQMRRGIEAGAHSGGGKNRGQRGRRRAFAVGSRDQH